MGIIYCSCENTELRVADENGNCWDCGLRLKNYTPLNITYLLDGYTDRIIVNKLFYLLLGITITVGAFLLFKLKII